MLSNERESFRDWKGLGKKKHREKSNIFIVSNCSKKNDGKSV